MLVELEAGAVTTRKMLALFPFEKSDYKPHLKSMPMGNLARHIAEIYGWAKECVQDDELDFAKPNFVPEALTSTEGYQRRQGQSGGEDFCEDLQRQRMGSFNKD